MRCEQCIPPDIAEGICRRSSEARRGELCCGGHRRRFLAAGWLDDLQGEVLELGEQAAEFLRVVEQGLVFGELGGGEPSGDGLAGDLAKLCRASRVTADIEVARVPLSAAASQALASMASTALALLVSAVEDYAIFLLSPTGEIRSWNASATLTASWPVMPSTIRST